MFRSTRFHFAEDLLRSTGKKEKRRSKSGKSEKVKWGMNDTDQNLHNMYYQRDLLYLYDRITLDMNYLSAYPDRNEEWLEKLLELKYEIRNLL